MKGLCKLYPSRSIESVYGFDFDAAKKEGIKALLFDIDNTLVPHDAPADERSRGLMESLRHKGFRLGLVSNNREPRVRQFAEGCGGMEYSYLSAKPKPDGYLELCSRLSAKPGETLFFGDQLFTDIWGANNAGIRSILVEPLDKSTDIPRIRIKRWLEKPILCLYKKGIFL